MGREKFFLHMIELAAYFEHQTKVEIFAGTSLTFF